MEIRYQDNLNSQNLEQMEMGSVAQENFNQWNKALLTKDPRRVAEFYTEEASFLPTVSGEFKKGAKEAEGYFEHFLEKNPVGKIIKDRVQSLSENSYLHSGLYNFELGPNDDRKIVEARFTYLWEKDDMGNWRIIHHHSSVKPQ